MLALPGIIRPSPSYETVIVPTIPSLFKYLYPIGAVFSVIVYDTVLPGSVLPILACPIFSVFVTAVPVLFVSSVCFISYFPPVKASPVELSIALTPTVNNGSLFTFNFTF